MIYRAMQSMHLFLMQSLLHEHILIKNNDKTNNILFFKSNIH